MQVQLLLGTRMKKKDEPTAVTIPTDEIAAIAQWASTDDSRPHLCQVLFQDDLAVATNGHVLIVAPCATHGLSFGVTREHVMAAVAAQDVIARANWPGIAHDQTSTDDGDPILTTTPRGGRTVDISLDGDNALVDIGAVVLRAKVGDISTYPSWRALLVDPNPGKSPPEGICFSTEYLADIHRSSKAFGSSGVCCRSWTNDRGPVTFENGSGVKFVVMPMRVV